MQRGINGINMVTSARMAAKMKNHCAYSRARDLKVLQERLCLRFDDDNESSRTKDPPLPRMA
jgi:hypothetical protein